VKKGPVIMRFARHTERCAGRRSFFGIYFSTCVVAMICVGTTRPEPLFGQLPPSSSKKAPDETYARVLVEGTLANAKSFTQFRCRYTISEGKAQTVERALAGGYDRSPMADVEWVVSGEKERFSLRANDKVAAESLKANAAKGAKGMLYGNWSSSHFLSNGRQQMTYTPIIRVANLFGEDNRTSQRDFLPPGAEGMGPGDKIQVASSLLKALDEGRASYRGIQKHRGAEVHVIRCKYKYASHDSTATYFVDTNRGFLLIRSIEESPRRNIEVNMVDAKRFPNAGWFPTRSLVCMSDRPQGPNVLVREFVVGEIVVEPPADNLFRIDLPKGTGVVDLKDARTSFVLDAPTTVGTTDLPKLLERAARTAVDRRTFEEGPRKSAPAIWWFIGAGVLAGVCLVGLWRRRSRSSNHA
jgi:hypothetical protein